MTVRRIGRDGSDDIVLADASVSRSHADLIECSGGRFYLVDRNSTNGSWRRENGALTRFAKAFVDRHEPIRLGGYETSIADLLRSEGNEQNQRPVYDGPVERDSGGLIRPRRG